jgi:hypothetical protein
VSRFRFAGAGHLTAAEAFLAAQAHARAREHRRLARAELLSTRSSHDDRKGGRNGPESAASRRA